MNIAELFTCNKFESYCKKIAAGNDLWQDLRSHVILILLTLESEQIKKIENLNAYANQIAYTEYFGKYSAFNKQLGKDHEEINTNLKNELAENIDEDYEFTVKIIEKDLIKEIKKNKFPVEHYFFQAYLELGTIRKTATFFNVSRSTTHRIIQTYKNRIKNEAINKR